MVFPGTVQATAHARGWTLAAANGTEVLPSVCASLAQAGARIAAIRVKEVDLADAFRALTGEAWQPAPRGDVPGAGAPRPEPGRPEPLYRQ